MATSVKCPQCETPLRVNETLYGKTVKCPKCETTFRVPESPTAEAVQPSPPPPPAPTGGGGTSPFDFDAGERGRDREYDREDDYDRGRDRGYDEDYDRGRGRGYDDDYDDYGSERAVNPSWSTVAMGLNLQVIGIVTYVITAILALVATFGGAREIVAVLGLIILLAALLIIIGFLMCLATPSESGAKGLVISAITLFSLAVLIIIFLVISALGNPRGFARTFNFEEGIAVIILLFLMILVASVLYILFLRRVALYFNNQGLADTLMVYLIASFVVPVVLIIIGMVLARNSPMGFQLISQLIQLGMLIWYITLLSSVRGTIGRALSRGQRRY